MGGGKSRETSQQDLGLGEVWSLGQAVKLWSVEQMEQLSTAQAAGLAAVLVDWDRDEQLGRMGLLEAEVDASGPGPLQLLRRQIKDNRHDLGDPITERAFILDCLYLNPHAEIRLHGGEGLVPVTIDAILAEGIGQRR